MTIVAPGEHELLVFWVQLAVLLATARLLGGVMRRFGQPAVIGELAAGLILGPSVFGALFPDAAEWLFPADAVQGGMLFAVGWIGVVLLLIVTGFETDLSLIARMGRAMAMIPLGSLVVPFLLGLLTGLLMPDQFLGESGDRSIFMLFMAAALSISALPVIAKVLAELGFMRRNFGQATIAAGMIDDIVGWIVLGIVAGLASSGQFSFTDLGVTIAGLAAFILFAFTIGKRTVDAIMRTMRGRAAPNYSWLALIIVVALVYGSITQYIGVEAVFGAFVAGIVMGRSRLRNRDAEEVLRAVTVGVFAPIFFATAGLRVDLTSLTEPTVLLWAGIVLFMASASKFVGTFLGAKLGRLPNREGLALAIGLNARGSLEIIIASVGLSLAVLNTESYSILVLMAMATSMMAPPLLRLAVRGWEGEPEERRRLKAEEMLGNNVVVRPEPILLPVHAGPNSVTAAQVMHLAWPVEVAATVLPVGDDVGEDDLRAIADVFELRPHELARPDPSAGSDRILAEAAMGYGVIGMGAELDVSGDTLFSPFVEEIIASSAIPTVIVRRALDLRGPLPGAFARAVVPIGGTKASRSAQEVAFNLSASIGTEIHLTHVVPRSRESDALGSTARVRTAVTDEPVISDLTTRLIEEAIDFAVDAEARVVYSVRTGVSTAGVVMAAVAEEGADLLALGARVRLIDGRPFLGHNVEQLLRECPATVILVTHH